MDTLKTGWWNDSVQLGSSSDTEPEAQFDIRQYFEAKAAESAGSDTGARDAAALSAQWRAWHYTPHPTARYFRNSRWGCGEKSKKWKILARYYEAVDLFWIFDCLDGHSTSRFTIHLKDEDVSC